LYELYRSSYSSGLGKTCMTDRRMTLDYLPVLRTISALDMCSSEGGQEESLSRTRRRSRLKDNYFEAFTCGRNEDVRQAALELSKNLLGGAHRS